MKKTERATRKLSDLEPSPYNPRTISGEEAEGLQSSIERFGFVQDIVVNSNNNRVVGGNQRLKILSKLGETEAPVVLVELTEDEEKALCVTLNNPHLQGKYTQDLRSVLASISNKDLLEGLRTDDLLDALEKNSEEDDSETETEEMGVSSAPKVIWALIGIPAESKDEASPLLEQIGKIPGVRLDATIKVGKEKNENRE